MDRALAVTCGAAIVALGAVMAIAAASCSDTQTATARDAAADARVSDASDAGSISSDASDAPYYNADGWVGLQGFDQACGIFIAPSSSAKNFPAPISWEPCDSRVPGVDGGSLSCRQIVGGSGYVASAYVNRATQAVTLPVVRGLGNSALYLVADADGPVHQAIVAAPPLCDLGTFSSVSATSVIYTPEEFSSNLDVIKTGALGGPLEGSLKLLRNYSNVSSVGYVAGANEFVEFGAPGFDTGSWVDGHRLDSLSTSAHGQLSEPQFQNDNLFFSMGDLTYGSIQMYAAGKGVVDFITFGNDTQSYAADFGTDGTDMVWSEAFGHPSDTSPWTTINIVTAPYTTTPSAIAKRRVRSETVTPGDHKFTVGCGYAVHEFNDSTSSGVRIVRLSDGVSWLLRNSSSPLLSWNDGVAITCSEIFINFNFGSTSTNLARIRLDSLGIGTPAD